METVEPWNASRSMMNKLSDKLFGSQKHIMYGALYVFVACFHVALIFFWYYDVITPTSVSMLSNYTHGLIDFGGYKISSIYVISSSTCLVTCLFVSGIIDVACLKHKLKNIESPTEYKVHVITIKNTKKNQKLVQIDSDIIWKQFGYDLDDSLHDASSYDITIEGLDNVESIVFETVPIGSTQYVFKNLPKLKEIVIGKQEQYNGISSLSIKNCASLKLVTVSNTPTTVAIPSMNKIMMTRDKSISLTIRNIPNDVKFQIGEKYQLYVYHHDIPATEFGYLNWLEQLNIIQYYPHIVLDRNIDFDIQRIVSAVHLVKDSPIDTPTITIEYMVPIEIKNTHGMSKQQLIDTYYDLAGVIMHAPEIKNKVIKYATDLCAVIVDELRCKERLSFTASCIFEIGSNKDLQLHNSFHYDVFAKIETLISDIRSDIINGKMNMRVASMKFIQGIDSINDCHVTTT